MSTGAGTGPQKKVEPQGDTVTEKAGSTLTSLSTNVDPYPHYTMSAACAGAAGYSYSKMNNPRAAAIAGGFSLLYLFAGRLLVQGHERLGYDVGTVASLGLVATAGPLAMKSGEAYSTALTTLGGMSSVANLLKSYQMRTGKPQEARITNK